MEGHATPLVQSEDECMTRHAVDLGIDLGLLDENLSLSPLARMRQHDENVRQVLAVRKRLGVSDDEA